MPVPEPGRPSGPTAVDAEPRGIPYPRGRPASAGPLPEHENRPRPTPPPRPATIPAGVGLGVVAAVALILAVAGVVLAGRHLGNDGTRVAPAAHVTATPHAASPGPAAGATSAVTTPAPAPGRTLPAGIDPAVLDVPATWPRETIAGVQYARPPGWERHTSSKGLTIWRDPANPHDEVAVAAGPPELGTDTAGTLQQLERTVFGSQAHAALQRRPLSAQEGGPGDRLVAGARVDDRPVAFVLETVVRNGHCWQLMARGDDMQDAKKLIARVHLSLGTGR